MKRYAMTPTSQLLMLLMDGGGGNRYLEITKELDRRIPVQAPPSVQAEKVKAFEWDQLPKPDWGVPPATPKCTICNSDTLSAEVLLAGAIELANANKRFDFLMETVWDLLDNAQRGNEVLDVEAATAHIEATVDRKMADWNLLDSRVKTKDMRR